MPAPDDRADPLDVDPLLSWARRTADGVGITLRVRAAPLDGGRVTLLLRCKEAAPIRVRAQARAEDGAHMVTAAVPVDETGESGTWRLALKPAGGGSARPLRTRLVLRPGQPVALLPPFAAEDVGN